MREMSMSPERNPFDRDPVKESREQARDYWINNILALSKIARFDETPETPEIEALRQKRHEWQGYVMELDEV